MQFKSIGTEKTRDINKPLLSKYCCLEKVLKQTERIILLRLKLQKLFLIQLNMFSYTTYNPPTWPDVKSK